MKRALIALVVLPGCLSAAPPAFAQRAVILVRHAEKVDSSADAALSKAGEERADRLATILKDAGVTAILTSDRQRTIRTAAPLAAELKLEPDTKHGGSGEELFDLIRKRFANDVVLVVGHRDTVPELVKRLGCSQEITIADPEYDKLFILVPKPGGPPELIRLRY